MNYIFFLFQFKVREVHVKVLMFHEVSFILMLKNVYITRQTEIDK